MTEKSMGEKILIGRNEWCALPTLSIPAIKAKIDTGAQTSALHAFNIREQQQHGKTYVKFDVHPIQSNDERIVNCRALVTDQRYIMSSNGHKERRYVIQTLLHLGAVTWNIEITLSNRDPLKYRLLLGREALKTRVIIDPSLQCKQGKVSLKLMRTLYP